MIRTYLTAIEFPDLGDSKFVIYHKHVLDYREIKADQFEESRNPEEQCK